MFGEQIDPQVSDSSDRYCCLRLFSGHLAVPPKRLIITARGRVGGVGGVGWVVLPCSSKKPWSSALDHEGRQGPSGLEADSCPPMASSVQQEYNDGGAYHLLRAHCSKHLAWVISSNSHNSSEVRDVTVAIVQLRNLGLV